jgi:hypothetical protein
MLKLIQFVLIFGSCQCFGFACSCIDSSGCSNPRDASIEFLGKVISVGTADRDSEYIPVDFSVSETFGTLGTAKTITVKTPVQDTACAYPFKVGVEYFVSASASRHDLLTSKCSRTQPAVTAAALIRQLRAMKAGRRRAQIYGFVGTEPYPGVSPLSRLSAKPLGSISVTAVGQKSRFVTSTKPDGSFEFIGLPPSSYHLEVKLPPDLFVWFASSTLQRKFEVRPGVTCEADIALYPKGDPFGR